MKPRKLSTVAVAILGTGLALVGALNLWISFIGDFHQGRPAIAVAGAIVLILGLALLAFPFQPRLSKLLGASALLAFAGAMLFLVFSPDLLETKGSIYRIAALALAVLGLARVVLPRAKRPGAGT